MRINCVHRNNMVILINSDESFDKGKIFCSVNLSVNLLHPNLKRLGYAIEKSITNYNDKTGFNFPKIQYINTDNGVEVFSGAKKFEIKILLDNIEYPASQLKTYLFYLLRALQEEGVDANPFFGESEIEHEEGLVLPFSIEHYNKSTANPLAGEIFSKRDFAEFGIEYHLPRMTWAELSYLNNHVGGDGISDRVLDLFSRIESVYVKDSPAHKQYEKIWQENEGKSFVEKAFSLLKNYVGGSCFERFFRGRWNLTHVEEVKRFNQTESSMESPQTFLCRLIKNNVENPYGSLSRRMHFIMMKAMEEAGLFPQVYACQTSAKQELPALN